MPDAYLEFAAAAQALRRRVEGLTLALCGALGVAADPYPHQVASVRRILSDTRIRHLLADEVGLGKTVQALMIINALRWQNPDHRCVVLVPDRLVHQWQEECWTRGHTQASVVERDDDLPDDPVIRLVRPQSIQNNSFTLDAHRFDMLVIDEPQTMSLDVMERVRPRAPGFSHLLILSATPRLGDPNSRQRIMQLLEPERYEIAEGRGVDPDEFLDELEGKAIEGDAESSIDETCPSASCMYRTYSRERRIIRARRRDWKHYLPGRRTEGVCVELLQEELERVTHGMRWLRQNDSGDHIDSSSWQLIRTLLRSRESWMTSLGKVIESQPGDGGDLLKAREAAAKNPGDTRFEVLLDILSGIWDEQSTEQVIIYAGDNPTIDFLNRRLRRYFDCEIAQLRRPAAGIEDDVLSIEEMYDSLEQFWSSSSSVLLLGDWIQAGLNLHYFTRNIVFYSLPWHPETVDQLIGRIDRLRPNGLFKGDRGDYFGNIRIWYVHAEGTPESEVARGLEALGVFDRPLPPMTVDEIREIEARLIDLARRHDSTVALADLRERADSWSDSWHGSGLTAPSAYSASAAQAEYEVLRSSSLPQPVLGPRQDKDTFSGRMENAFRGWTDLLNMGGFFNFTGRQDSRVENRRFSTVWYKDRRLMHDPFMLPEMGSGGWMSDHVPFIYRRRDLARPPVKVVHTDEGETDGRLLRFLDHGDPIHDTLVDEFIVRGELASSSETTLPLYVVSFTENHPALRYRGKILLITLAMSDPGTSVLDSFDDAAFDILLEEATNEAQRMELKRDRNHARDQWRGDQRWLRMAVPAVLDAEVSVYIDGKWASLAGDEKWEALKPIAGDGQGMICARGRSFGRRSPKDRLSAARRKEKHGQTLTRRLVSSWGAHRNYLAEALRDREFQVKWEGEELISVRKLAVDRISSRHATGTQVQLVRGQVKAAQRRVRMSELILASRLTWLGKLTVNLGDATPDHVWSIAIQPAMIEARAS